MNTTIKINGLDVEFSEKVPTRAGVYWWIQNPENSIGEEIWNVKRDAMFSLYVDGIGRIEIMKGLWSTSPLVPAVEVEKGFWNGVDAGMLVSEGDNRLKTCSLKEWDKSRAKRVIEGGE